MKTMRLKWPVLSGALLAAVALTLTTATTTVHAESTTSSVSQKVTRDANGNPAVTPYAWMVNDAQLQCLFIGGRNANGLWWMQSVGNLTGILTGAALDAVAVHALD